MRYEAAQFTAHLRGTRSARTAKTYGAIAASFFAFVEDAAAEDNPGRADVEAFLARPLGDGSRRSPATRNQELAALRAFSRFARGRGIWRTDPTDGVAFVREPRRNPTVLSAGELRGLFEVIAVISLSASV